MPTKRFINARVTLEEHEAFDNQRHAEKTTWQELIPRLLRRWLSEKKGDSVDGSGVISRNSGDKLGPLSSEELEAVGALLAMMRSGDPAWRVVNFALETHKGGTNRAKSKAETHKGQTGSRIGTG